MNSRRQFNGATTGLFSEKVLALASPSPSSPGTATPIALLQRNHHDFETIGIV